MLEILQTMLQQYLNQELPNVQAGFRKSKGIRDQIVNTHCIIENVSLSHAQFCVTPMDCGLPGSSVHGIIQVRILEWVAVPFSRECSLLQGIFPSQGSNPGLPHCRWILYRLSHQRSSRILEWVAYPFSRGSSQPRSQTGVPCTAGAFFTR